MKETGYARIVRPLLSWYEKNARDLPWRETKDPYRIWVSEIMLQQTRVEAVKEYYARFLKALPDVEALAKAPEEVLLKLWEGLGYYSRVRNMQKTAKTVMEEYGGRLPSDYGELIGLSGIGPYTAAAIASIAFKRPKAVVDGNVLRVFMRLGADNADISDAKTKRDVQKTLDAVIEQTDPGSFNQAMMDLGAMICVPNGAPLCDSCPLASFCEAYREGRQTDFPVKSTVKPRKIEKMTVFLIRDGERYAIRKRPSKGLLAGMYEPVHAKGWLDEDKALLFLKTLPVDLLHIERISDAKHIFTHKEWHMIAYEARIAQGSSKEKDVIFANRKELSERYPIPSAFSVYLSLYV